ncbi:MAG: chemotaxis protein CheA [Gemmatimonadaceae bacterium]|nr:chemotaxis protein CheA [Gemmatimonadaceae bacterium]
MPSPTLNDLAARLIATEATDADYHEILDILVALANDPALPEGVRALMGDALIQWTAAPHEARERVANDLQQIVVAAQNRLDLRDRLATMLGADEDAPIPTRSRVPTPVATVVTITAVATEVVTASGAAAALLPADADLSLLPDFIAESRELLEHAEAALLALELDPDNAEAVNTIFRAFHTIKGTSAFLSLDYVTEFAHHAETILSRVRDREIRCVGGYADLALRSCDMIRELLDATQDAVEGRGETIPTGYDELLDVVRDPETNGISERGGAASVARATAARADAGSLPDESAAPRDTLPGVGGGASVAGGHRRAGAAAEPTVRVRTERLDRLIEMVGELVIAESMISQDPIVRQGGHLDLNRKISHAEKIVRELQDLSMAMRMVPLKGPFQKVARLVRDLASRSGKRVEFVAEGEDTEIDRNMVDFLGDPLVHMVRNSVDHGIEPTDERRAAGKPEVGRVRLSAYHASGNVVVEMSDDGRGLDRDRIVRKAMQQGLIASAEGLSDKDVHDLIFAPGFSTAETVTDVSGRGVGMDVVRRNIEALRGRVEIQSRAGQGTTFIVRLPLTLAITDGMLVRVGSERYIVPTINIHLSFRPPRTALSTVAGKGETVMLRDQVMPLVRLHRVFGVQDAVEDPTAALLMVVGDGTQRTALLVDELLGQQQVVAKSLGNGIGRVSAISGGAILGDGRVGLILDVNELLTLARFGEADEHLHSIARAVA